MLRNIEISLIFTGGTISSGLDGTIIKPYDNSDIIYKDLKKYPEISNNCVLRKPASPFIKPSENIEPSNWKEIIKYIIDEIGEGSNAIIVSHGSDTMAYTVNAVSFAIQELYRENGEDEFISPVPIIFTSALSPLYKDAIRNFHDSIIFAAKSKITGVFVSSYIKELDTSRLFRGNRLRSISPFSKNFETYDNKFYPYPNESDCFNKYESSDQILSRPRAKYDPNNIEFNSNVSYFKIYPGFKAESIEYAINKGSKGIILELYHSGTASVEKECGLLELLKYNKKHDVKVPIFGLPINDSPNSKLYETTSKLIEEGLIALNMSPETALVKLMWLTGKKDLNADIKEKMKENLTGEVL